MDVGIPSYYFPQFIFVPGILQKSHLKKNDPGKFGSANGRKQFTFARGFSIHRAACSFVNKSPSSSSEIFTTKFDLENNL